MERKLFSLDQVEVKFYDEKQGTFGGYASVFNGINSYGDTILPGAYKRTLKGRKRPILMRWQHFGPVIGKWTDAREDEKGLWVEGELTPGHSLAADVYASMKHGAVNGLSIGYVPVKANERPDGIRELKEIELVEISIVEEPADNSARVAAIKSVLDEAKSLKEIEDCLRDACGLSRSDATALVSRIKAMTQGEPAAKPNEEAERLRALFASLTQ